MQCSCGLPWLVHRVGSVYVCTSGGVSLCVPWLSPIVWMYLMRSLVCGDCTTPTTGARAGIPAGRQPITAMYAGTNTLLQNMSDAFGDRSRSSAM